MRLTKTKFSLAAASLLLSTTAGFGQSTEVVTTGGSGSIAVVSPTGFLVGGGVQLQNQQGASTGNLTITRNAATISVNGGSSAGLGDGISPLPQAQSYMDTRFEFDRNVGTRATVASTGNALVQGEALGSVGVIGQTEATASRSGSRDVDPGAGVSLQSGSASVTAGAEAGLVGDFRTQNSIQLVAGSALFSASQGLDVGERNAGIAAVNTGLVVPGAGFTDTLDADASAGIFDVIGTSGAALDMVSELENNTITINAANAGFGGVSVTFSTGGFFDVGTIAKPIRPTPTLVDTGGFFDTTP